MSEPSVSYVIPVHNQIAELRKTVRLLVERLGHLPGSEIILVENGSTDGSGPLCLSLATALDSEEVAVRVTTSAKGLGFAWRRGMAMARGRARSCSPPPTCPSGSPTSTATSACSPRPRARHGIEDPSPNRRSRRRWCGAPCQPGSACCARGLIGLDIDTQGSVLIQRCARAGAAPAPAHRRLPDRRRDQPLGGPRGVTPVEVPVVYTASGRSTVSPLRDSVAMAAGLFALRRRLADEQRPVRARRRGGGVMTATQAPVAGTRSGSPHRSSAPRSRTSCSRCCAAVTSRRDRWWSGSRRSAPPWRAPRTRSRSATARSRSTRRSQCSTSARGRR